MSNAIRRVIINTKKAPAAIGPYNQAVMVNQTVGIIDTLTIEYAIRPTFSNLIFQVYLSGQIGFEPTTMTIVKGGVKAETRQALKNMGEVLK